MLWLALCVFIPSSFSWFFAFFELPLVLLDGCAMSPDNNKSVPSRPAASTAISSGGSHAHPHDRPLAAHVAESGKRPGHWLESGPNDNPRPPKHFAADRFTVVFDSPLAIGAPSSAIDDTVLHELIFPRQPSTPGADVPFAEVSSVPYQIPRLVTRPALTSKRPARSTVSASVDGSLSRSVVARPSALCRPRGFRGSNEVFAQAFPSIGDYHSCFCAWIDGRRFAAVPVPGSFRGRSRPSEINQENPASA